MRAAKAPIPTMLRHSEVQAMTGLSRSGLYKLLGAGAFPKPVQITSRAVRFKRAEVDAWLEAKPRVADYSPAN